MGCCQSTPKADQADPAQTTTQAALQHPAVAAKQEPAAPAAAPGPVGSTTAHLKAPTPLKTDGDGSIPKAAGISSAPAVEDLKASKQQPQPHPASTAQPGPPWGAAAPQEAAATSLPPVARQGTALGSPPAVSSKLIRKSFIEGIPENATPLPPLNEAARVATVDKLGCISFPTKDPQGNMLTSLLSTLGNFPLCFIMVVGEDKQWMKWAQREHDHVIKHNNVFPKAMGMAPWVLSEEQTQMIVQDRRVDDIRFRNDEVARRLGTGLATPVLASDGHRIGAMVCNCTDTRPVTYEFCALLNNMAELAARELERDALIHTAQDSMQAVPATSASQQYRHILGTNSEPLTRSIESLSRGIILCDASKPGWPVVYVTTVMARLANRQPAELVGKFVADLLVTTDDKEDWSTQLEALKLHKRKHATRSAHGRAPALDPDLWVNLAFHCATTANLECEIGIPSFAEHPDDEAAEVQELCLYTITVDQQASCPSEEMGHPACRPTRVSSLNAQQLAQRGYSLSGAAPQDSSQLLFDEAVLETLLGKGSFGCVFRATWRQQEVALKVLEWPSAGEVGADAEANEMKEAAMAIEFYHPHIVRTLAYAVRPKKAGTDSRIQIASPGVKLDNDLVEVKGKGQAPGQKARHMEAWIVMELCSRGCLQDANDRGWLFTKNADYGTASPDIVAVVSCGLEIAQGMAYLHEKGCVHRDLTSGNVLLAASSAHPWGFICKIADFGMSRIMEKSADPTDTVTMGTVTHMPPELLMEGKLSPAADVYAFGVLLWSMLTGERPFSRMSRVQVMVTICIQKKQLELPAHLPTDLSAFTKLCLATNPKDRPTFEEAVSRLQIILSEATPSS